MPGEESGVKNGCSRNRTKVSKVMIRYVVARPDKEFRYGKPYQSDKSGWHFEGPKSLNVHNLGAND